MISTFYLFPRYSKNGIMSLSKRKGVLSMATNAKDLQIMELKDTIAEQRQLISTLRAALDTSTAQIAELTEQTKLLNEQLEYMKKKLFGTSSEKRQLDEQLNLFNEAEYESNPEIVEPEEDILVTSHARKPKTKLVEKIKGLPVETIEISLNKEDLSCLQCGTPLEVIGREVVRHELEYVPASLKVIKYVSLHYGCPECKQTDEPYFAQAPVPKGLMKHSLASPSSVAWVMYQKYANGLPLYRQEKDWKQSGMELSRATMANWVIYCAEHYLRPVYNYCHKLLLGRAFLMADETRVQVLKEPGRKAETDSFMWVYRSGEDGLPPIILYQYTQSRSGMNAQSFLDGFKGGYLMTDAYSGYNKVQDIKRCCCFAHIRRYFYDAIPKGKEYDISHPAVQGVEYCNHLFRYEEKFKKNKYSYEQVKEMRLKYAKPVLEAFLCWLNEVNPTRNSRLDKAVTYARNRKDSMLTYLEDGRCSLSNNLSEQKMKSFVIGRKGWLFCDTPAGAEASAIVYSLVEMAKDNKINVFQYLKYLLEQRPSASMTEDQLAKLLPWNEDVLQLCKI